MCSFLVPVLAHGLHWPVDPVVDTQVLLLEAWQRHGIGGRGGRRV
jgi:hypothetical protein